MVDNKNNIDKKGKKTYLPVANINVNSDSYYLFYVKVVFEITGCVQLK